ncbi:protein of unknown function [Bacillus sp. 491mf]|nr:DUF4306 domain-containing protein [Bacillus sp. 491mf]SFC83708.1 protein of unknown function [Bacillus sp. 491mf]
MLKKSALYWLQYIIVLLTFIITFIPTSIVGSKLMIEDEKKYFVFTPQNATEYSQISEIDKVLFAFSVQPIITIVCLLSLLYLLTLIIIGIVRRIKTDSKKQ